MNEIADYIDKLEDRNKAYKDLFDMLIQWINELNTRIEKLEKEVNNK